MKLSPKNSFVKNNFAYQLALHELDLEKANQIIDEVLSTLPNEARYLDTKGLILFQQGKYADAKTYFERACGTAKSNDKTCIEHLGDVLSMLGDMEGALSYWLKAKELGSANKMLNEKITQRSMQNPFIKFAVGLSFLWALSSCSPKVGSDLMNADKLPKIKDKELVERLDSLSKIEPKTFLF